MTYQYSFVTEHKWEIKYTKLVHPIRETCSNSSKKTQVAMFMQSIVIESI